MSLSICNVRVFVISSIYANKKMKDSVSEIIPAVFHVRLFRLFFFC